MALIQRAQRGDAAAVDALLRRLRCVRRFLAIKNARMGGRIRRDEMDDLEQQVLLQVWRKVDSYEGRCSLEGWVYGITHLELLYWLRCRDRLPDVTPDIDVASDAPPPEDPFETELVYRVLGRLDHLEATVIQLRHLEQLDFEGIARRMQLTTPAARNRYYRGLEKARRLLAESTREVTG